MITNWILGSLLLLAAILLAKTPLGWALGIFWAACLGIFSGVDLDEFWSDIWESDDEKVKSL